jgi:hypothetical protein
VRSADLVASGSSEGVVRLWKVSCACTVPVVVIQHAPTLFRLLIPKASSGGGGRRSLAPVATLPMPGFVNGLAFSKDGKFILAATGQVKEPPKLSKLNCLTCIYSQEHRLGRWDRIQGGARNALALVRLPVSSVDADSD